jgi:hypothetical protein
VAYGSSKIWFTEGAADRIGLLDLEVVGAVNKELNVEFTPPKNIFGRQ